MEVKMAVDELERDYLGLLHQCDNIENITSGLKMAESTVEEQKLAVGNMVMYLENEILDDKYTTAGKSLTRINEVIAIGRTYWKS